MDNLSPIVGSFRNVPSALTCNAGVYSCNTRDLVLQRALQAGGTPLLYAAGMGRLGCVRLLLGAKGLAVDLAASDGTTALMAAASEGREDAVEVCFGSSSAETEARALKHEL